VRLFRRATDGDHTAIVGLGNPGDRYANNRHNLGAMVLDALLARTGLQLKRHKSGCLAAETTLFDKRVILARPVAYMNESGAQVGALARFFKLPPENVVVVHDELDIPFGQIRVKLGGGVAGHNGLRSVASHLRTKEFVRVRVGISRPGSRDAAGYVLSDFSAAEKKDLPDVLERAADAVERVVEAGAERAMNEFNTR
jgi:PTH1 family peptidyl-tRNA hydrolase